MNPQAAITSKLRSDPFYGDPHEKRENQHPPLHNAVLQGQRPSDYSGEINYDDAEIRQIGSGALYDVQSIIQQNVFVFNATIRENITMFKSFPNEEIDQAVELSGLKSLISEKGEDYLCGENGCGLSGGEKQRISIARSLLKKSKILLVDEATSSLDKETAHQVSEAILNLNGITAIVVTHALEESQLKNTTRSSPLKTEKSPKQEPSTS